jgi:hypothetical protein
MIKSALREVGGLQVLTTALLLSPLVVFVSLCIAEDYFCVWSLVQDRYRVIWLSIGAVVASSALIELNKEDTLKLVGEDPVFGTTLFSLSFLSLNINGVLVALFLIPYRIITIITGAPCAP